MKERVYINLQKIAILTDSASNIAENIEKHTFVLPLYVNAGGKSRKDIVEISCTEVYEKIEHEILTTAAPSTEDFLEKIAEIKALGYDAIIGIAISSKLSATYNTMRIALEESHIPHALIDSKNVSFAEGFLVYYAQQLLQNNTDLQSIAKQIEEKLPNIKLIALVPDLKYLIRGGRLKPLKGFIGSMLHIQPILCCGDDGKISSLDQVRGANKAIKRLAQIVQEELRSSNNYMLAILHGRHKQEIFNLKALLIDQINQAQVYEEQAITAVLSTQAGPDIQGVAYLKLD